MSYGQKYPIVFVAYDPDWPARFEAEAARLRGALGAYLPLRIEHFGSTAVPGLGAKPIIDVLLEVPSLDAAREPIAAALATVGYLADERKGPPPYMCYYRGYGADGYELGVQRVHCHAAPLDHVAWERLRFRDWLRAHPKDAAAYEALKRRLAALHPNDREAYTDAKADFVADVMARSAE